MDKNTFDKINSFALKNSDFFIKMLMMTYPLSMFTVRKFPAFFGEEEEYRAKIAKHKGFDSASHMKHGINLYVSSFHSFLWSKLLPFWDENKINSHIRSPKKQIFRKKNASTSSKKMSSDISDYVTQNETALWKKLSNSSQIKWTKSLLKQYENKWDWEILSGNSSINWDEYLINEYKEKIHWNNLSRILNSSFWTEKTIEAYGRHIISYKAAKSWSNAQIVLAAKYINWETISTYKEINWTMDFVERHKEKFNWNELSKNKKFPWNKIFLESYQDYVNWESISANPGVEWDYDLIKKYEQKLNWRYLSRNSTVPWQSDFLEKYRYKVNFRHLTFHIKWDIPLIDKYQHNLSWRTLSARKSIDWTEELIDTYKDKLFWFHIVNNMSIPWNYAMIEKFKEYWCWDYQKVMRSQINPRIKNRQLVIQNLFTSHLSDKAIETILKNIEKSNEINK